MWRLLRGILIQTVSGWLEDKAPRSARPWRITAS